MTGNTGLLTARCDPFGAESRISLLGGMYSEKHLGERMWHCDERAQARYRYICAGGIYGTTEYECPGGHRGQVMPLCRTHAREFTMGPPKPGWRADRTPVGQIGGTVSNEMCPRCMWPGDAAELHHSIERVQAEMVQAFDLARRRDLNGQLETMRTRMDELNLTGVIHKCPLRLTEVS